MQKGTRSRCPTSVDRDQDKLSERGHVNQDLKKKQQQQQQTDVVHSKKTIISKPVKLRKAVCCRNTATHFSRGMAEMEDQLGKVAKTRSGKNLQLILGH